MQKFIGPSLVALLLACCVPSHAVDFQFIYVDNAERDFAARGWLDPNSLFQQNIRAAGHYWGRLLDADRTLRVQVNASRSTGLASGGPLFFFSSPGSSTPALPAFELAPLAVLRTGTSPIFHKGYEMQVSLNPLRLSQNGWFDPTPDTLTDPAPFNQVDFLGVMLHELGHGLGVVSFRNRQGQGDAYGALLQGQSPLDALSAFAGDGRPWNGNGPNQALFLGQRSQEVFGAPVPLTSFPPGDPLSGQNFSHLGQCDGIPLLQASLMSGCPILTDGHRTGIAALELALLEDLGYPVLGLPQTPIDARFSGSFYPGPGHDGEGWLIQVLNDRQAVVYWFTYPRQDGFKFSDETRNGAEQSWIFGLGEYSGPTLHVPQAFLTRGGVFGPGFNPRSVVREPWGALSFVFDDCHGGAMAYVGPEGYSYGSLPVQRLSHPAGLPCEGTGNDAWPATLSGAWYDPAHDGEGWLIEVLPGDRAVVYWFTYDSAGNQAWVVGAGVVEGNRIVVDQAQSTRGGTFGPYFDPRRVERLAWGSLRFEFTDCNRGTLSYQSARSGSGRLALVRLTALGGLDCR